MTDYKQTRDAAGNITSQYGKMLRNLDDDLVKQYIAELQDLVRCRCMPAYTGRGLHDPDCECDSADAVQVVSDRIEELEAKLEKAVEALEWCATVHDSSRARTTLAEQKGQDDG